MRIRTKRIYEAPSRADGYRVLIDRLWPRGIAKADAKVDAWVKDLAPSDDLRRWFGHDPSRWTKFQHRYRKELQASRQTLQAIVEGSPKQTITLLYAARDEEHNNALVMKDFIEDEILAAV